MFGRMVVTCVLAIGLLKSGQRRVAAHIYNVNV